MRRAILCGVLALAGCARPTDRGPSERPAVPGGNAPSTAEEGERREAPGGGRDAAGSAPGDVAEGGRPPAAEMALDPNYTPRDGDRATLLGGGVPGFARAELLEDYFDAHDPEGQGRLRAMIDRGELVELQGDMPVLVIRNLDPAGEREPGRHYGVEVRVLAGAHEGQTWFVDESVVVRLVPRVIHPPLAPGSYATVAGPGTPAYPGWEALDPAARPPRDAAGREVFRLAEGARVVVLEAHGEAVRVRVEPGSSPAGRVGVVARSALRPLVPPSGPALAPAPAGPRDPDGRVP